jgi:hypothetical protein
MSLPKFKAKAVDTGEWVYFNLGECGSPGGGLAIYKEGDDGIDINPATLCQFTGQTDMEGEIYNNDRVDFDWVYQDGRIVELEITGTVFDIGGKYIVRSDCGAINFDLSDLNQQTFERFWKQTYPSGPSFDFYKLTNFKITGNIHDEASK